MLLPVWLPKAGLGKKRLIDVKRGNCAVGGGNLDALKHPHGVDPRWGKPIKAWLSELIDSPLQSRLSRGKKHPFRVHAWLGFSDLPDDPH